jgi:uncharacterized protein YdeI (YjbR/CyaY-like superfamily)
MSNQHSKRIDVAYAKFTGEIADLLHDIRSLIHSADVGYQETWKWGPGFEKDGTLLIGLWGFKKHVSLVFYRGAEMSDKHKLFNDGFDNAHNRMIKFSSHSQLNSKKLLDYIKESVKAAGTRMPKTERSFSVPVELSALFIKQKRAHSFFETLSPSCKREYCTYVAEAKQEVTRKRRAEKVIHALKEKKKSL